MVKVKVTYKSSVNQPSFSEEIDATYFTLNAGVAEIWVEQAQTTHIIYIPPGEYTRLDVVSERRESPKQNNNHDKRNFRHSKERWH
jgi:hypothetical protein